MGVEKELEDLPNKPEMPDFILEVPGLEELSSDLDKMVDAKVKLGEATGEELRSGLESTLTLLKDLDTKHGLNVREVSGETFNKMMAGLESELFVEVGLESVEDGTLKRIWEFIVKMFKRVWKGITKLFKRILSFLFSRTNIEKIEILKHAVDKANTFEELIGILKPSVTEEYIEEFLKEIEVMSPIAVLDKLPYGKQSGYEANTILKVLTKTLPDDETLKHFNPNYTPVVYNFGTAVLVIIYSSFGGGVNAMGVRTKLFYKSTERGKANYKTLTGLTSAIKNIITICDKAADSFIEVNTNVLATAKKYVPLETGTINIKSTLSGEDALLYIKKALVGYEVTAKSLAEGDKFSELMKEADSGKLDNGIELNRYIDIIDDILGDNKALDRLLKNEFLLNVYSILK